MIDQLRIRNLGVIESADLTLGNGMTALTGETGAGKTMALTSLLLLAGGKADPSKVRTGAEIASVEGTFVVDADSPAVELITGAGGEIDIDDDGRAVIYISRQVPRKGRSRAYAGGRAVPLAVLQELAGFVLTVHGQADQLRLSTEAAQREALDRFGGVEHQQLYDNYRVAWQEYNLATEQLESFVHQAREAGTQRLALEALISRVDAVKPEIGEEEQLRAEAHRLENVEALRSALAMTIHALDGDDITTGAIALCDNAARELSRHGRDDSELAEISSTLADLAITASEIANRVRGLALDLTADPRRLDQIHERRAEITKLQRELGMDIPEILQRRATAAIQLAEISDPQTHLEHLRTQVAKAEEHLRSQGQQLGSSRRALAKTLASQVTAELHGLAMKDATFTVSVTTAEKPSAHGTDDITFMLAPHRASAPLPLAKTASGGEMSRIMLALEVTLAGQGIDADHTFIFDEIDAGIGGKTALRVGERLAQLGAQCQTIVVTHLAQVAAYAHHHVVVDKISDAEITRTDVRKLDNTARERELARMLSGHEESEAARTHAGELLLGANMSR
ncbi:MAG: DNA repair protein RecN [Actinomycetaceae bacterium]|nr:DNA repair protein RecN [Actinomycetaceae bacterium]